jgi:xylulokinase
MPDYWMGIDVGTGGTRALLAAEDGRVVAGFTAPHAEITMAQPLWAEQHPGDWWRAAQAAIRGVLAQVGASGADVRGIGFSGQMHGVTMLDGDGEVVRPALIWCDQRSQPQVDWINAKAGAENVLRWTANPVLTGFTLPKFLWVRDHQPELFAKVRHLMLPKDYVRFRLSGEFAADVSDASGTALFDVVRRRWSREMCEAVGVDPAILPPVYESAEVCARVSSEGAAATGLEAGTPLVAGAGDQAASAVGNGIVRAGVVSCTLGTSGVVFAHMENVAYDPEGRVHTFCHAVPGKWHVMGVTQGAGLSLQWFRNQLAPGADYDALMAEAAQSPAGADGLFWLPYLMGERTPILDPLARGGWIGLTARHRRADLIRALVEGVSYSQKDCLDLIGALGVAVDTVRASGGGARSAFWRQVLADVFAKRVTTLATQEGSAYGAALLAMAGTGRFASVEEACGACVREVSEATPGSDAARYARGHEIYRSLYPALKPAFHALA